MEIFKKEIFPKQHRFFIWAVVLLIAAGMGLLGYIYYVNYEVEDLNQQFSAQNFSKSQTFKVETAATELKEEVDSLSSDVSDLEKLSGQEEQMQQDLNNFNF